VAAAKPLVVTKVGGIPEIFEGTSQPLVEPGNAAALAAQMLETLDAQARDAAAARGSEELKRRFSVAQMATSVEAAYRDSL
jgi:glycosyltransferase involved in cell wall biosynthesis